MHRLLIPLCVVFVSSVCLNAQTFESLLPPAPGINGAAGAAVATSDRWVVVGEPSRQVSTFTGAGAVHVYDRRTRRLTRLLLPKDPSASGGFGASVALSGNTVMVGAPDQETEFGATGAVYLFSLPSGRQTLRLTPDQAGISGFGRAVAIDGFRAVVGTAKFSTGGGSGVSFYDLRRRTDQRLGGWNVQPLDLANSRLGTSLAILGRHVLAGDPGLNRAFLFSFDLMLPVETLQPTVVSAGFGTSVAMHGRVLAVGAPQEIVASETRGAVYVYHINQISNPTRLVHPSGSVADEFGRAVALSGSRLFVGVPGTAKDEVRAYLLDLSGRNFNLMHTATLERSVITGQAQPSRFGSALACFEGMLAIGDPLFGQGGAAFMDLPDVVTGPFFGDTALGSGVAGTNTTVLNHPGNPVPNFRRFGPTRVSLDGSLFMAGAFQGSGTRGGRDNGLLQGFDASYLIGGGDPLPGSPDEALRRVINPVSNSHLDDTAFVLVSNRTSGHTAVLRRVGNDLRMVTGTNNGLTAFGFDTVRSVQNLRQPSDEGFVTVHVKGRINRTTLTAGNDSAIQFIGGTGFMADEERGFLREGGSIGEISPRLSSGMSSAYALHRVVGNPGVTQRITEMRQSGILFSQSTIVSNGGPPQVNTTLPSLLTLVGAVDNPGQIYFRSTFKQSRGQVTSRNNEAWIGLSKSNTFFNTITVAKGEVVKSSETLSVRRVLKFFPTAALHPVVLVQLSGPGVTAKNDLALLWWRPDLTYFPVLLREGDGIGSSDGAVIHTIQRVEVARRINNPNFREHVMVLASLRGGHASRNQVLLGSILNAGTENASFRSSPMRPLARKGVTPGVRGFMMDESVDESGANGTGTGGALNYPGDAAITTVNGRVLTLRTFNLNLW